MKLRCTERRSSPGCLTRHGLFSQISPFHTEHSDSNCARFVMLASIGCQENKKKDQAFSQCNPSASHASGAASSGNWGSGLNMLCSYSIFVMYWPGTTTRPTKRLVMCSLTDEADEELASDEEAASGDARASRTALALGWRYSWVCARMTLRSCGQETKGQPGNSRKGGLEFRC